MFRLLHYKWRVLVWAAAALFSVVLGAMGSRAQSPIVSTIEHPWGFITQLTANEDVLSVTMDVNPQSAIGCVAGAVYTTRNLHHALLLGAFLNHKRVSITTYGCLNDGFRIVQVAVRDD